MKNEEIPLIGSKKNRAPTANQQWLQTAVVFWFLWLIRLTANPLVQWSMLSKESVLKADLWQSFRFLGTTLLLSVATLGALYAIWGRKCLKRLFRKDIKIQKRWIVLGGLCSWGSFVFIFLLLRMTMGTLYLPENSLDNLETGNLLIFGSTLLKMALNTFLNVSAAIFIFLGIQQFLWSKKISSKSTEIFSILSASLIYSLFSLQSLHGILIWFLLTIFGSIVTFLIYAYTKNIWVPFWIIYGPLLVYNVLSSILFF